MPASLIANVCRANVCHRPVQPLCRLHGPRIVPRDRKDTNIGGAPPHTVDTVPRAGLRQPIDRSDHGRTAQGRSQVGTASGPESPSAVVVGCDVPVPTQIVQLFPGAALLEALPDQPVADAPPTVMFTFGLAL